MRLRRREHARSVSVCVSRPGTASTSRERCEFVGGRDDWGDRQGARMFGGADGDLSAPAPAWPAGEDEIEERLSALVAAIGDGTVVRHRTAATGRSVLAGTGAARERVHIAYALTGRTVTDNGRTLPIGVSGRGDGLAVLGNRRLADEIAWTRATLAAAGGPVSGRPPAVLVHEAVGHYAEAIHVGAPAVHRLFTRIADGCLSVVDSAGDPGADGDRGGRFDDEGVLSLGPTEVVHEGVLVAQLHSRATARAAAASPTGNGRAAMVWDAPIPRISNLICTAGPRSEEELVDEIGSGVYIHRLADGYRQGTQVRAHVVLGEHVRRGRRTGRYFTGGQVAGRANLLTGLVELGNRTERSPNAMCGKDGQLLYDVGTVAPAMRLSALPLVP